MSRSDTIPGKVKDSRHESGSEVAEKRVIGERMKREADKGKATCE